MEEEGGENLNLLAPALESSENTEITNHRV